MCGQDLSHNGPQWDKNIIDHDCSEKSHGLR